MLTAHDILGQGLSQLYDARTEITSIKNSKKKEVEQLQAELQSLQVILPN